MNFNKHLEFAEDDHAFLSPSRYHWVNYTLDKLTDNYANWEAAKRGTRLHAFAKEAIDLKVKLKGNSTLARFVNDAIGYRMTPEVMLVYSFNCFGTADAISFNRGLLRIHDLKTGVTPAKMMQLEIYAALFCLEYKVNPSEIGIELRIYQNDEVFVHDSEGIQEEIQELMLRVIEMDRHVEALRSIQ